MKFGEALEELRAGKFVSRAQWSGDQFLFLAPPSIIRSDAFASMFSEGIQVSPSIHIKMTGWATPWTPQHLDLLADDWGLVMTPVVTHPQPAERPKPTVEGRRPM